MPRDCDELAEGPPAAAVALVLAVAEGALLLCRRAAHPDDPWSGHWCLPGGRIEAGDVDAVAAARRELAEECGVTLAGRDPDAALPQRLAGGAVGRPLIVAPFLWRVSGVLPLQPDPREVERACWVPVGELGPAARRGHAALAAARPGQLFPYIELEGAPLWGFTLAVLEHWLAAAPPDQGPGAAKS